MKNSLVRAVSLLLVLFLVAEPVTASAPAFPSLFPIRVTSADQRLFEQEAVVSPVIRMLRFILSQTTAPSTEVRLISGWTTARPEVTVETTHTPDPNYWPKIHRQATASLERVTDSQERKMLEQALALADRDLKEHSAMASLDELGIFHPDEDSLWNYALGIWIANWVPTWALSQRVAAFRQIYETLLDDSLQHEAAHRELNNLPEKYRDALDAEARRMKMSDEDIQRRKHDHLIAQLLDDLGRNNPNHRDLGQSDTADAERLYKIVSQVPSINTLYKARFERKIQHGFDGFSPQVQNELIQKELKALEVLYPFQERSQVVLQAVEEYSKQVGQPLRSYGRLLQEYDSLDRFARQTSPRRA